MKTGWSSSLLRSFGINLRQPEIVTFNMAMNFVSLVRLLTTPSSSAWLLVIFSLEEQE